MKKKAIKSWMLYDWANSAFATTMMAAVLPVFYSDYYASNLTDQMATSYWGYTQSIAVFIVAVLSPVLGAISDYSQAKKKFLRFFAYMGIIASILFAFVGEGQYLFASILMVIGSVGFSGGNVFYDAFLPEIADKGEMDKVSTSGFAFGYIGGGVLLFINILMILQYEMFGFPNVATATKTALASVGIWWFLFSLPLFKNVKEEKRSKQKKDQSYLVIGFQRVGTTFRSLRNFKQLFLFLIAFWLFNDGISTIIRMATVYGREIGIASNDLIVALLITQFVGIPCTFLFGWLAGKIHPKKALTLALLVYVAIVILGYFMSSALHFYLLAVCVGFVQGGSQALSRSIFGRMVPRQKEAEFYGFYGISSKFAAIVGPFVFGLVGQITGSSRLGILALLTFFIVGIILLQMVNIEKGEQEALEASK
ncbi:MFS transporter, UMF1 family [Salinibacillus kushneri]|uniref:MFS transporter, UMF1 family n=1 Tax=Salinibacillus kushneri TaxID=237682 RepID=A0A1I0AUH6_9BACI|nr:MFS transporter [Salinibacillus kushneri]SES98033.1 MFS transporter, UMF1 family [Salinibacillus kushneri]